MTSEIDYSDARARAAPARPYGVRRHNLGLVLRHLASTGPRSRAQLAAATGLTKATVSSIVAELLDAGLVAELGVRAQGEIGRPGSVLTIDAAGSAGLGLEINVDYLAVCVIDLGRQTRFHRVDCVDNRDSPGRAIDRLAHMARTALDAAAAQGLVVSGLAVALPGVVDADGVLLHAPNLGWRDVPVADLLGARLGIEPAQVMLDNEANLAALAELWFGEGATWGDYLHVSGEIGVGAGIVSGGRVSRGARGFAGEVGHLSLDMSGPACPCGGRGCLERYCGQEAILQAAGLDPTPTTATGRPDGSLAGLLAALEAGRARPVRAVRKAGTALGRGVAGAVNLLDVETVVLGGIYSPLAPWLAEPFTEALRQHTIASSWEPIRIEISRLGPDAAVRGAAGTVTQRVLADPTSHTPLAVPGGG
ncbi:MAG: ROK family protein [Streptosporangiales bacterium]|nr:ROK family protein [Streptosporangiales bacterium]